MKLHGKTIEAPTPEIVVIPRQSGDLVFTCQAVLDYTDHDRLNPEPQPGKSFQRDKKTSVVSEVKEDMNAPEFQKRLEAYSTRKMAWMMLTSLSATEGLEWENVDPEKPDTWENYLSELKAANLSIVEINRIQEKVFLACAMDDGKLDEAHAAFMSAQAGEAPSE